jgi:S-formylglutathione hydrolase FrmB
VTTSFYVERSDAHFAPRGVTFATLKSLALDHRADISFYCPAGAETHPTLPLVILLHGAFGSHWDWLFKGGVHRRMARLVAQNAVEPMLLAMPSDGLWGHGSGFVPHTIADYERWIVDEVPAVARQLFPAVTAASPIFVAGLSMGGFAALRLAGKYPDRIAAASAHSVIISTEALADITGDDISGLSSQPEDKTILAALLSAPGALPPLRFDCGADDPLLATNRDLHLSLSNAGVAHLYFERTGGHDWAYWGRNIGASLRFFSSVGTK